MPHQSYSRFFWGLILVTLDLKLNRFDILPDFIGYILIALGASRLSALSHRFSSVVWPAYTLSAFGFIMSATSGLVDIVLGFIQLALHCGMMWTLLGAVAYHCGAHGHLDLVASAHSRRLWYVCLLIGLRFAILLSAQSRDLAVTIGTLALVSSWVVLILILSLLRSARLRLFGA